MPKEETARTEIGRLAGLKTRPTYPVGRVDIEFQGVAPDGSVGTAVHTLKLIVTDHEAKQLAGAFAELALQLAQAGGAKQ